MNVDDEPQLSAIFVAASVSEVDFVEKLLNDEGIEYEVRPEAFIRQPIGGTCLQGLLFHVRAGQASYCRRLLESRGLERGVVKSDDGV